MGAPQETRDKAQAPNGKVTFQGEFLRRSRTFHLLVAGTRGMNVRTAADAAGQRRNKQK